MDFTGVIKVKQAKGLYLCKPTVLVTHFLPNYARCCFPCFDEPAFKAIFDVTIRAPADMTVISNMSEIKTTKVNNGLMDHVFNATPLMSTFVLAFVICNYESIGTHSGGVAIKIYAPKEYLPQCSYALEIATKGLNYFKEYLGVSYSLKKLDLVTIPNYGYTQVSNWGLAILSDIGTYLQPEDIRPTENRKMIALNIGHTLGHMWFGCLVTFEWWSHLWLAEGTATFLKYHCLDSLFPKFGAWSEFVNDILIPALNKDCLEHTYPVVQEGEIVEHPFNFVVYKKGAALLRMLQCYISDEYFRKGLRLYLTRHMFKSTVSKDLFSALEEASKKPVNIMMDCWTSQKGYPMIIANYKQEGQACVMNLTQMKFDVLSSTSSDDTDDVWIIPICVSSAVRTGSEIIWSLMRTKEDRLAIPTVVSQGLLYINPGTIGFYRVLYTPEILEKFIPSIERKTLSPASMVGILNDAFAMAKMGHISSAFLLEFMTCFVNETDYSVWSLINQNLKQFYIILKGTKCEGKFNEYIHKLLSKIFEKLGWDTKCNETYFDTILRSLVINGLIFTNNEKVMKEAKLRFDSHMSSGAVFPKDIKTPLFRAVLRMDKSYFTVLMNIYNNANESEQISICKALGAVKTKDLKKQVLDMITAEKFCSRHAITIMSNMIRMTVDGCVMVWKMVKHNWKSIVETATIYELNSLMTAFIENMVTDEIAADVEQVADTLPGFKNYFVCYRQMAEQARLRADWARRDRKSVV